MSVLKPKGLRNQGNSCFMNSALQCLTHSPNLAQFFLKLARDNRISRGKKDILRVVIQYYMNYSRVKGVYVPRGMFQNLRRINPILQPGQQHDSHEFIVGLLDKVSVGLKKRKMIREFKESFIGSLNSEVICSRCKNVSRTKEDFTTISLVNWTLFELEGVN